MGKKFTYNFVNNLISDKEGILLSKEYINSTIKLKIKCKCQNIFNISFNSIRSGHWCAKCAFNRKRLDSQFVKKEIKKYRFELLSNDYTNTKEKLKILCLTCNYIWDTTFVNFQKNNCPGCSNKITPAYKEVKLFIKNKNGRLLSKTYKNNSTKLEIKCLICSTVSRKTLSSIKLTNIWCKNCRNNIRKKEIAKIIGSRGEIIEFVVTNKRKKIKIKCNNIWITRDDCIKSNHWCLTCSGNKKYDFKTIKNIVEDKNGTLLSKSYVNNKTPIHIKCNKCFTEWSPLPRDIMRKDRPKWCPGCCKYKSQKILKEVLEDILKSKAESNFYGFKWLKNDKTGKFQHIDIFFKDLKIAIEYDGQQHSKLTCFGKKLSKKDMEDNLKYIQKMDKIKNKKIKQHPEDVKYFIRFNYKDKINKESVKEKLIINGIYNK